MDGVRRRMLFSTCFVDVKVTPLHCQVPLSGVRTKTWTNLIVHVSGLVEVFFPGAIYKYMELLALGGNFKVLNRMQLIFQFFPWLNDSSGMQLRRIFTLRHPPLDTVNDCEVLFLPFIAVQF